MAEKTWEEMSPSERDDEWKAMPERERSQFRSFRDAREELKSLKDYIEDSLLDCKYPQDLILHVDNIQFHIDEWAEQKWCSAVDEVMETRIDCELERLVAA